MKYIRQFHIYLWSFRSKLRWDRHRRRYHPDRPNNIQKWESPVCRAHPTKPKVNLTYSASLLLGVVKLNVSGWSDTNTRDLMSEQSGPGIKKSTAIVRCTDDCPFPVSISLSCRFPLYAISCYFDWPRRTDDCASSSPFVLDSTCPARQWNRSCNFRPVCVLQWIKGMWVDLNIFAFDW